MATAAEVDRRIYEDMSTTDSYPQIIAVNLIRKEFDEDKWLYKNKNGNWAISKEVLAELYPLKKKDWEWLRGRSTAWQRRDRFDEKAPGAYDV